MRSIEIKEGKQEGGKKGRQKGEPQAGKQEVFEDDHFN